LIVGVQSILKLFSVFSCYPRGVPEIFTFHSLFTEEALGSSTSKYFEEQWQIYFLNFQGPSKVRPTSSVSMTSCFKSY